MTHFDQRNMSNFKNPYLHPCLKEAELSMKCLEENHYDNRKCTFFFENFNKCREFWNMIKLKRIQNKIKPAMPTEKERKLILAEKERGNIVFSVKVDSDV